MAREVVVEIDGDRATIALNRPEKLNALDLALVASFEEAAGEIAADSRVAIVVVRGYGRSFCAGLDLDMFAAEGMSMEFYRRQERGLRLLETMDKTVVAALHGHCLGGGVQLAAACDVRVGSSDAVIGLPAVQEGLFPGMAPYRLPRLIGKGRAASLILTGRSITAEEAERIGLIDHVVDADDFDAQVAGLVDEYARAPREAAAASKRLMALSYEAPFGRPLSVGGAARGCLRAGGRGRSRPAAAGLRAADPLTRYRASRLSEYALEHFAGGGVRGRVCDEVDRRAAARSCPSAAAKSSSSVSVQRIPGRSATTALTASPIARRAHR